MNSQNISRLKVIKLSKIDLNKCVIKDKSIKRIRNMY